ncbi:MAG: hypothetical protein JRJ62_05960 [Deltaproteobacteria bacterium]|nr:hypothetical protein [Deltaproteobacteria bacterium]
MKRRSAHLLRTVVIAVFSVMIVVCISPNSISKDDVPTDPKIVEVIRAVQKDMGFNKIQSMRFKLDTRTEKKQKEGIKVTTAKAEMTFKRPSYIRKDKKAYGSGKLRYSAVKITDGISSQITQFNPDGELVMSKMFSVTKENGGGIWDNHPLFESKLLNPKFYSRIEQSNMEEAKVYILSSDKPKPIYSKCWFSVNPWRIIKFQVKIDKKLLKLEVTDFKYKEIAPGIWYPASYTMHFPDIQLISKIAASHFEVNIDIPSEAFMFLPGKADTKK